MPDRMRVGNIFGIQVPVIVPEDAVIVDVQIQVKYWDNDGSTRYGAGRSGGLTPMETIGLLDYMKAVEMKELLANTVLHTEGDQPNQEEP